jgi:cell division protease FtsH
MNNLFKNVAVIFLIFVILIAVFGMIEEARQKPEQLSFTSLAEMINNDEVSSIEVIGSNLNVVSVSEEEFSSFKESEESLSSSLLNYGVEPEKMSAVEINVKKEGDGFWVWILLVGVLPLILFGFFFWFIFRQAKGGGGAGMQAMDFTRSRARMKGVEGKNKEKTNFNDVAGLKEAKDELKEIIEFLKNPRKFLSMGAKIPRGVLLLGPAGVGKTLLARAVAGEAGVPFFHTSGSSFVELFVGTGAARIRDLFSVAKRHAPCIIFIDELDAVGRMRGTGIGGGNDEREQTLNQLLVEMDGFDRDTNVIVIAATNRADVLDSALLRPGRFDRRVVLDSPDVADRKEVLGIHCLNKPLNDDVDLKEVAERTSGFSGADLANLANEAAILAARFNQKKISQKHFLDSIEKVMLGPERRSHLLSKKEKEITAYHEIGHALVSSLLPGTDPVRKISIVSRGSAAGYTLKSPKENKRFRTKTDLESELAVLLAGYCTEKFKFNEISSGSSNDLERAWDMARRLVEEFGMSSLGPISSSRSNELVFLGRDLGERSSCSEEMSALIDKEIVKIVKQAEKTATDIIKKNKSLLEKITKVLIEKETIEKEEYEQLLEKKRA